MDDLHFGFTSPAHACIMIYVHELKSKLLKSKFECCPVFQLWQILVPWNSDDFLSRLPRELQSWFVHTPKWLEFPLRLFSPICTWKGKTYRHTIKCMIRTYRKYFFIWLFLFQTDSKFFRRATTLLPYTSRKLCSLNHVVYQYLQQECLLIKFFTSKNRTFVSFTVFKDNVAHATEVQEIQPGEIYIFSRQIKCKFISRLIKLLKSRNLSSSFLSSPSRQIMAPSTCSSLLDWWNFLNNLTKLNLLYSKDISFVRITGTKKNVWE